MPSRPSAQRAAKDPTEQQLEDLRAFKLDPRLAMESLVCIEDRDNPGRMIPFKLNPSQDRLHKMWERVRAFRLIRNIEAENYASPWGYLDIPTLQGKLLREKCDTIAEYGVSKAIHELKKSGFPDIHAGPVRIVVGKPRQVGISTYVQARFFTDVMLTENFSVNITAHLNDVSENIFRKTRLAYESWPLGYEALRTEATGFGADRLELTTNSRFVVQTAGSPLGALSFTFGAVHLSESAFYKDYTAVNKMMPAVPKWATVVDESTGNGRAGPFFERWKQAMFIDDVIAAIENEDAIALDSWNGFFKFFIPWFEDPEYTLKLSRFESNHIEKTLDEAERSMRRRFPGRVSTGNLAWRRLRIRQDCQGIPGMDPADFFKQEWPADETEMFQSQGTRVFAQDILEQMEKDAEGYKPSRIVLGRDWLPLRATSNANLHVYQKPKPGELFVIGIDVAKGLKSGDWSVISVFNRTDGTFLDEAARWRGKIDPVDLGDVAATLGEWFNGGFITPELNDQGHSTARRLFELQYPHMYKRKNLDSERDSQAELVWQLGFVTNGPGKYHLIGRHQHRIRSKTIRIRSQVSIHEHAIYENVDKKLKAPEGENDDCVIADALCTWGDECRQAPVIDPVAIRRELKVEQQKASQSEMDRRIWESIMREQERKDEELEKSLSPWDLDSEEEEQLPSGW